MASHHVRTDPFLKFRSSLFKGLCSQGRTALVALRRGRNSPYYSWGLRKQLLSVKVSTLGSRHCRPFLFCELFSLRPRCQRKKWGLEYCKQQGFAPCSYRRSLSLSSSSGVAPRDSSLRSRMTTWGDGAKDLERERLRTMFAQTKGSLV